MLDKYLLILPQKEGNFEDEWNQCLGELKAGLHNDYDLVKLNIFVAASGFTDFIDLRKVMLDDLKKMFNDRMPACNITVHPPEKPWKIAIEAGITRHGQFDIQYRNVSGINYVTATLNDVKLLWCGGAGAATHPDDATEAAGEAFSQMKMVLETEDMNFDHIVRQWNYIGNITRITEKGENYHNFNGVRSKNYAAYRTKEMFPSATGIGIQHGGVSLDFFAAKGDDKLKVIPVNNPDQVKPYQYGQVVLKGVQCPQFERAMILSHENECTLFISGTASILGQDTIGVNDVEKQTIVTIENIMKLVDAGNRNDCTGTGCCSTGNLILLRVYIKRQSDFEKVKKICKSYFNGAPSVFIEADVCRENLLVEIEAEFHNTN